VLLSFFKVNDIFHKLKTNPKLALKSVFRSKEGGSLSNLYSKSKLTACNKSSKVDLMQSKGFDVLAPIMDYTTNDSHFSQTLEKAMEFQPHLIVGSSMGGYFASHIGTHYSTIYSAVLRLW
jgi:hypothetical protein